MDFVMDGGPRETGADDYCRSVEAYLCRKNDGHLIRLVGPAFERVCAWAERGVPLKVAYRGIDRYFERYYAQGPRRRPVRIEFCEADVLDVFDEWRRAVGVLVARERREDEDPEASAGDTEPAIEARPRSRSSLAAHLDRALARLASVRAGTPSADDLDDIIRELEAMRGEAKSLRGSARHAALERLRALDAELAARARARLDALALDEIRRDAEAELAPFRDRMPVEAYGRALEACIDRSVRERERLPVLSMD